MLTHLNNNMLCHYQTDHNIFRNQVSNCFNPLKCNNLYLHNEVQLSGN